MMRENSQDNRKEPEMPETTHKITDAPEPNKFKQAISWLNANKVPLLTGAALAVVTVVGGLLLASDEPEYELLTDLDPDELTGDEEIVEAELVIDTDDSVE